VTYTAAWGRPAAVCAWLSLWACIALTGGAAALRVGFGAGFVGVMSVLGLGAAVLGAHFLRRPATAGARRIETFSALGTLALHASLGPLPLLLVAARTFP
jgi:hypothetical protein